MRSELGAGHEKVSSDCALLICPRLHQVISLKWFSARKCAPSRDLSVLRENSCFIKLWLAPWRDISAIQEGPGLLTRHRKPYYRHALCIYAIFWLNIPHVQYTIITQQHSLLHIIVRTIDLVAAAWGWCLSKQSSFEGCHAVIVH